MQYLLTLYDAVTRTRLRTGAFLLVLSLACFLPGFFTLAPMDRDEARFAQATKQMVETGDYLDIRNQDQPRYKKPAGIYWLQAAAVTVSGQGADAPIWVYRIPSLLGAVAVVLLTYWTGLALMRAPAAALAAAMVAALLLLGVEARLAKSDAVLCASILAAMGVLARLCTEPGKRQPLWLAAVFWIAGALGILVKGPIWVMVVALAAAVQSATFRSAAWLRPLRPLAGFALLLVLVLPWFVAITLISDGAFWGMSLGHDAIGKFAGAQESHGAPPGTFLAAFFVTAWPLIAVLLLSLGWIWRSRSVPAVQFLLCWIVPAWIIFELAATKLPHYVLPLYPAIALLGAAAMDADGLVRGRWWTRLIGALGFAALVYGPPAALGLRTYLEGEIPFTGIAVWALSLPLGLTAVWWGWRERMRDAVVLTVLAAPLFYFAIYEMALARIETVRLSPRIAASIARNAPCSPASVMATDNKEMSLVFLLGTDLAWGDGVKAAHFLDRPGCRIAVIGMKDKAAFEAEAARLGLPTREIGSLAGYNLGDGRFIRVGIFANGKR